MTSLSMFALCLAFFTVSPDDSAETKAATDVPPLPAFEEPVDTPEVLRQSYEFAASHPEVVEFMPCFCACAKTHGHRSLEDCFIKSRATMTSPVVWNSHGGECSICVIVAQEARRLKLEGKDVRSIREAVEAKFGSIFTKYHTDTPWPPADGRAGKVGTPRR